MKKSLLRNHIIQSFHFQSSLPTLEGLLVCGLELEQFRYLAMQLISPLGVVPWNIQPVNKDIQFLETISISINIVCLKQTYSIDYIERLKMCLQPTQT